MSKHQLINSFILALKYFLFIRNFLTVISVCCLEFGIGKKQKKQTSDPIFTSKEGE